MRRLIIRHVGPINSIDIELNKVNVFIGPQGCGKSTIAKIISFCSWLEKQNDATFRATGDGLIKRLCDFHHLDGYFSSDSVILYIGDNIVFLYNWPEGESLPFLGDRFSNGFPEYIHKNENFSSAVDKIVNPKVSYIPAERNFVSAIPNLKDYSGQHDNIQSFVNDWYDAKRHYTRETPLIVEGLNIGYFYNQGIDVDYLSVNKGVSIPLSSASSGFQSIVPLWVLVEWLSAGIYKENKPFSPAENEKFNEILEHISNVSEVDSELMERISGFLQGRVYTHTQFIIEEPEQNLFPKTQMDLLYHLLKEINHGRNHHLVLTTHSPYVLYALNNCMLAYLVKDKVDSDVMSEINCMNFAFNPQDVSVWSISDGVIENIQKEKNRTIQDDRGLIRRNYFDDVMKEVMSEFNMMLPYYD